MIKLKNSAKRHISGTAALQYCDVLCTSRHSTIVKSLLIFPLCIVVYIQSSVDSFISLQIYIAVFVIHINNHYCYSLNFNNCCFLLFERAKLHNLYLLIVLVALRMLSISSDGSCYLIKRMSCNFEKSIYAGIRPLVHCIRGRAFSTLHCTSTTNSVACIY